MTGGKTFADRGAALFSGGTDSTLAAYLLARHVGHLTLLTFNPGFIFFAENSRRHADRLAAAVGTARVSHVIREISALTREILFGDWRHDARKYGFNLTALCCLGCRLSMHAAALIHCLEHGIPVIVDGSTQRQSTIPEQLESVLRRNRREIWGRYGIRHYSPIYEEESSDRRLEEVGISFRRGLKRQFIFFDTQATCPFGVTADVYGRLFYGRLSGHAREVDSHDYCREKYPVIHRLVEQHFEAKGVDLATLVGEIEKKAGRLPPSWPEDGEGK